MPSQKKKKVLIVSGSYGHLSQAKAALEIFSQHFGSKNVKLITPKSKIGNNLYNFFYLYFPSLFRLPFWAGQFNQVRQMAKYYGAKYAPRLKEEIDRFQPDLVLATHFLFCPSIEKIWERKKSFRFYNLLSDPITIHPILFDPKALNLVYDKAGVKLGKKYGLSEELIVPIGWLVRQQFYQKQPQAQLRERLDLQPEVFTLLICGGSEGTNTILKILPALLKVKKPVQVLVVAGKNTVLYQVARSFECLFSRSFSVWESQLKMRTFRFVKNLAPLIQASDLVVGKAGPNLIFETVACKRPFFAITHIHGQEDGNLWLIKKKKLGWVEENGEKATKLLLKIIQRPTMVAKWKNHILKEKEYLQSAEQKLLSLTCIT